MVSGVGETALTCVCKKIIEHCDMVITSLNRRTLPLVDSGMQIANYDKNIQLIGLICTAHYI